MGPPVSRDPREALTPLAWARIIAWQRHLHRWPGHVSSPGKDTYTGLGEHTSMATTQHVSATIYAPPHTEPQPTDAELAVVFRGDGEPQTARGLMRQLEAFEGEVGMVPDSYDRRGTVE